MKKRITIWLLCLCMVLSYLPPQKTIAGEDITIDIGEIVTLSAYGHGSWYWASDNAATGSFAWSISNESVVAGDMGRKSDAEFCDLIGLRAGIAQVTLYSRDPNSGKEKREMWNITVTENISPDVLLTPDTTVKLGTVGENVKGTITDIGDYSALVDLVPVYRDGLWGYANGNMELVIPFQYLKASSFASYSGDNKYAVVVTKFFRYDAYGNPNPKYSYVIDAKGEVLDLDMHRFFGVNGEYINGYNARAWKTKDWLISQNSDYYKNGNEISEEEYKTGTGALQNEREEENGKRWLIYNRSDENIWYFRYKSDLYANDVDDYALIIEVPEGLSYPGRRDVENRMIEDVMVVQEKESGKYGVIDNTGKLVIPLEYDYIQNSNGGYMSYKKGEECGLLENPVHPPIKKESSTPIPTPTPKPSATPTPTPKPKPSATPTPKPSAIPTPSASAKNMPKVGDNVSGLVEYRSLINNCGLIRVRINGKYGYVNKDDILVIPCVYEDAGNFDKYSSLAGVKFSDGKKNLLDVKGNPILKENYDDITVLYSWDRSWNPVCAICARNGSEKEEWTNDWFDEKGNPITPKDDSAKYEQPDAFLIQQSDIDAMIGTMPKVGDDVSELIEDCSDLTSRGLTGVRINGKYGYVDQDNVLVIPCIYEYARTFNTNIDLAAVQFSDGGENVIDRKGNLILQQNYDEVMILSAKNSVCAICAMRKAATGERVKYWFDEKGNPLTAENAAKETMPKVGDDVSKLIEEHSYFSFCGLYSVKIGGLWGYVDENNILVIPCRFTEASMFDTWSDTATVKLSDGKQNIIDMQGNLLLDRNYDHVLVSVKKEIGAYDKPVSGETTTYYYFDLKGNLIRQQDGLYRAR